MFRLAGRRDSTGNLSMITPILAYFDPGSGSLLLQALVGGTAGLFVFGKYLWDSLPRYFGCYRKQSETTEA